MTILKSAWEIVDDISDDNDAIHKKLWLHKDDLMKIINKIKYSYGRNNLTADKLDVKEFIDKIK